ncbi:MULTISPECIES: tyrosine-type recombinase/integrase [unclassified Meiothermus]|uniref:tyrosine-type recombinase/integrase n=1 Tax=unclassified Meiothermus TaxID=370471 RepID=UPI000D7C6903|nr:MULTISPECIES: tyrosine-type recombinase/integrase [unclassified Meiothermus]PZA08727.1 integrase [Meiothermus sp. Pnk-1]RYM40653.1 integrase [Meiothermus sp. PNK-Is4]
MRKSSGLKRQKVRTSPTIRRYFEAFLLDGQSRGLSPKTIAFYRDTLIVFLRNFGDWPPEELTADDLKNFLRHQFERGMSHGGVHAVWRAVRAFLNWLRAEGVEALDPKSVKGPRLVVGEVPVIGEAEVRRLLEAAETSSTPLRDRALILALWDTASRASEVLGLRLDDVQPEGLRVRRKGGMWQVLPVSSVTRRAIRVYVQAERPMSDSDRLFLTRRGDPMSYEALRSMLWRLSRAAGQAYKPPHSFRRGAATTMVRDGLNPFALQTLMGHRTPAMTQRYVRLAQADLSVLHAEHSPVSRLLRRK